jgi:hypothetical protein
MSITRGYARISLSRIGLFSGSVFNLSSAQAAVVWEPVAVGSDNHTTDLTFAIKPELTKTYLRSLGVYWFLKKNTKLSIFLLTLFTKNVNIVKMVKEVRVSILSP